MCAGRVLGWCADGDCGECGGGCRHGFGEGIQLKEIWLGDGSRCLMILRCMHWLAFGWEAAEKHAATARCVRMAPGYIVALGYWGHIGMWKYGVNMLEHGHELYYDLSAFRSLDDCKQLAKSEAERPISVNAFQFHHPRKSKSGDLFALHVRRVPNSPDIILRTCTKSTGASTRNFLSNRAAKVCKPPSWAERHVMASPPVWPATTSLNISSSRSCSMHHHLPSHG